MPCAPQDRRHRRVGSWSTSPGRLGRRVEQLLQARELERAPPTSTRVTRDPCGSTIAWSPAGPSGSGPPARRGMPAAAVAIPRTSAPAQALHPTTIRGRTSTRCRPSPHAAPHRQGEAGAQGFQDLGQLFRHRRRVRNPRDRHTASPRHHRGCRRAPIPTGEVDRSPVHLPTTTDRDVRCAFLRQSGDGAPRHTWRCGVWRRCPPTLVRGSREQLRAVVEDGAPASAASRGRVPRAARRAVHGWPVTSWPKRRNRSKTMNVTGRTVASRAALRES